MEIFEQTIIGTCLLLGWIPRIIVERFVKPEGDNTEGLQVVLGLCILIVSICIGIIWACS